ncbi:40S ribosomal protein S15 [Cricetulus griseus]|uniref:40S ribosomal protein S15 n=1 Tax=Cricetulus griseus TaxID=10029 RepID=G3HMM6_CRIGR|nr:40S ribosomal protein S15 [Cricetulus griseus]
MAEVKQKKKQTFCKFTYHGVDLDQLLDMSYEQLMQLYSARQRQVHSNDAQSIATTLGGPMGHNNQLTNQHRAKLPSLEPHQSLACAYP